MGGFLRWLVAWRVRHRAEAKPHMSDKERRAFIANVRWRLEASIGLR